MNSLVLGGILKRVYDDFSMKSFENRLKLQKIIYLIQTQVTNLGYTYDWYLYGPYSTQLTRDAYAIEDFSKIKPVGFESLDITKKFDDFMEKLGKHKDDNKWLEVASSIHLLKKLHPEKSKSEIVSQIQNKRGENSFTKDFTTKVWSDIEGWII